MPESAYPTTTADQREPSNGHVPAWISVFILFGALAGLIILFGLACWFARSVLGRSPTILLSRETPPGMLVGVERDEVVTQKMRKLDESAPAKKYSECRVSSEDEDGDVEAAKKGLEANTHVVCSICLDALEDSDVVRQLSCRHTYHSDCIVKWYMKKHDTCPLCKTYYVPHEEEVAVPPRALLSGGINRRDEAMLRFYQAVSV